MTRLDLDLPDEFATTGDDGRPTPMTPRAAGVPRRTDGSGEPLPVIVRWFETWATGQPVSVGTSG